MKTKLISFAAGLLTGITAVLCAGYALCLYMEGYGVGSSEGAETPDMPEAPETPETSEEPNGISKSDDVMDMFAD